MKCTLAVALATLALAPAHGRGDTPPAMTPAAVEPAVTAQEDLPARRDPRAALRAQLRSAVPQVRRQAAAVGAEIASRTVTERGVVAHSIRPPLERPLAETRRLADRAFANGAEPVPSPCPDEARVRRARASRR